MCSMRVVRKDGSSEGRRRSYFGRNNYYPGDTITSVSPASLAPEQLVFFSSVRQVPVSHLEKLYVRPGQMQITPPDISKNVCDC